MNKAQNNPKGILFILIGMGFFSIQDALIKFVYNDAALYELYFGRTIAALFLLLGFFTSLSLILAIGAQNIFVIEQGLKKQYTFIVCFICLSD